MKVHERSGIAQDVYDIVTGVLGIDGKQRGDELDFSCPVHDDRSPSCGVNLTSGVWHCLSCGAGGDLTALVMAVKGIDRRSALHLTKPQTPSALLATLNRATQRALGALHRKPIDLTLPHYQPCPVGYLLSRGYTEQTLDRYGVGYVEEERLAYPDGRGISIRDYAALPIRDRTGLLLGWCYRACHPTSIRYLYTPGLKVSDLWFGMNVHEDSEWVVVTEGALDSMWVHQAGFPSIALLGANMRGKTKLSDLVRYRGIILFLDRDTAGVAAARDIGSQLLGRVPVKVVRYPKGSKAKDPAELDPSQIARAIDRAIPYTTWA